MSLYCTLVDDRLVSRANHVSIICVCMCCVCVRRQSFIYQAYNSPSNHGYGPIYRFTPLVQRRCGMEGSGNFPLTEVWVSHIQTRAGNVCWSDPHDLVQLLEFQERANILPQTQEDSKIIWNCQVLYCNIKAPKTL